MTSRARGVIRSTHTALRFVAGAFLCALGWVIVFFTSMPRTRLSSPERTKAASPQPIGRVGGDLLPHPSDFPPGWCIKNYGPSERRLVGTPTHLAPYGERMDELDG